MGVVIYRLSWVSGGVHACTHTYMQLHTHAHSQARAHTHTNAHAHTCGRASKMGEVVSIPGPRPPGGVGTGKCLERKTRHGQLTGLLANPGHETRRVPFYGVWCNIQSLP